MEKILLLICDENGLELIEKLSQELSPNRSVVLCEEPGESTDDVEYRKLPAEASEDALLKTIQELSDVYDAELICCVAGDAALGLLVANAMALGSAYKDRLCHVQTEPFQLTDIPFTRLCYLYQDRFNRLPENYADTVELANLRVSQHIDAPEFFMSADPPNCMIGESELPLTVAEFTLYWLLAVRCKNEVMPIHGQEELQDEFQAFVESTLSTIMPEINEMREELLQKTEQDVLDLVDSLSAKIKEHIAFDNGRDCALPVRDHGIFGISFPPNQVIVPRNY